MLVRGRNNASLGMQAAYNQFVPAFEALFEAKGRDFPRFYAEVRRLAALPKAERRATLGAPEAASRLPVRPSETRRAFHPHTP